MKKLVLLSVLFGLLILLNMSYSADWKMVSFDLNHSGIQTDIIYPLITSEFYKGNLIWNYSINATSVSGPTVVNGTLYYMDNYGIVALNATTGAWKWNITLNDSTVSHAYPLVDGDYLYAGIATGDCMFYALNVSDNGSIIWYYNCTYGDAIFSRSGPALYNNTVYFATATRIVALNASNGNLIWDNSIENWDGSTDECSPAIFNNTVFITSEKNKTVYAFDAITGSLMWNLNTGAFGSGFYRTSPTIYNNTLYVTTLGAGADNGSLWAIVPSNGTVLWNFTIPEDIGTTPLVVNDIVYIGSCASKLLAINATNGSSIFNYTQGAAELEMAPTYLDGVLYTAYMNNDYDVFIHAINATNGDLFWSTELQEASYIGGYSSSLVIVDGILYAYTVDNGEYMYAMSIYYNVSTDGNNVTISNIHPKQIPYKLNIDNYIKYSTDTDSYVVVNEVNATHTIKYGTLGLNETQNLILSNMTASVPLPNKVNITIYNWTDDYKKWNASSSNSSATVSVVLGNVLPNTWILVNKSGSPWRSFYSNSSGYVTVDYSEGFSTIQFEAGQDTPPIISNGNPSGTVTGSTQTLSVTTNENAQCRYSTTPGTPYPSMDSSTTTSTGTSHTWAIETPYYTTYNYYIRCNDSYGSYNTEDYTITFAVSNTNPSSGGAITESSASTTESTEAEPSTEGEPEPIPVPELEPMPEPGETTDLPPGGARFEIDKGNFTFLFAFGDNITINNITRIDPNRFKVLACYQGLIDAYEINLSTDESYLCVDTSKYENLEDIHIYQYHNKTWTRLQKRYNDTYICGKITSTPYMIAGFKTSASQKQALSTIESANNTINKALLNQKDVSYCIELLNQAIDKYWNCEYAQATQLATKANQCAGAFELPKYTIPVLTIIALLVALFYLRLKHKVKLSKKIKK